MTGPVPSSGVETFLNNLVMGLWAMGGSIMRGKKEWRDPESGAFSLWRMAVSLVTAFVLGQIAISICAWFAVPQGVIGGLAATIGYLGAPATIGMISDRLTGQGK